MSEPLSVLSGRILNIEDLDEVIALLERHFYDKTSYYRLGLRLKLLHNTLVKIRKEQHGGVDSCFTECLASWLRKADRVKNPTIHTLIAALREIGENAVADGINGERGRQTVPMSRRESLDSYNNSMLATPPTLHTSEGHPTQPVAIVNPGVCDLEQNIDKISALQEIAHKLQGKFDFLIYAVKKSLEHHGIKVDDAKILIKECLKRKARVVPNLKPCIDILEKANDFKSFFEFLSKYDFIGYLNYTLLKKLSKLVNDDEINKLFFEYEKEYARLLSSASFQTLIPLFEKQSNLSPNAPLGLPYVSFHLERSWFSNLLSFWTSTLNQFSWSYDAILKQLQEGCIVVTCAILPFVLDDVIRDLGDPKVLKKLEDNEVTVFEIEEGDSELEWTITAITYHLPFVYRNNLITLMNEAILMQPNREKEGNQKEETNRDGKRKWTSQPLEESLHLLYSHCGGSLAKLCAFLLQCLSALGWERGELVNQLKSKADVTFSFLTSYPKVVRRAGEIKEKNLADLFPIGAEIDLFLLGFYVGLVRLSLSGTLLPPSTVPETFYEMLDCLLMTTESPSEAASIVHSILSYFHCNVKEVSKLGPYLIPGFSLRESYPEIYIKLRFAEFLYTLGEDNCKLAMMAFSHIHLNDEPIDKYSPLEFVGALFDRCEADTAKLNELAKYFNQPNYFQQNQIDAPITQEATIKSNDDNNATPLMQNEQADEDTSTTTARLTFMINPSHLKEGDFRKLEKLTSELPLEIVVAQHLNPPISDIVVKNFITHLHLKHEPNKNVRPFSRKEQFAIHLAIQGLNVTNESIFSESGVLTHPLVYVLLDRLGYPVNELAHPPTEIEKLSIYLKYPDFDMLLTLASIVRFMSCQESEMFASTGILRRDTIPSSTSIVLICDALTKKYKSGDLDMNQALRWLEESNCSEYRKFILEHFERCTAKHKALERGMQEGYISINNINVVICGPPCVGKRAFQDLLLDKPPLHKHHSTPIAAHPVQVAKRIAAKGKVWKEITEDDLLEMLSDIIHESEMKDDAAQDASQSPSFTGAAPLPKCQATLISEASFSSTGKSFSSSLPAPLQSATAVQLVPRSPKSSFSSSLDSPMPLRLSIEEWASISLPVLDHDYDSRKITEQSSSPKMEGSQKLHEATWIYLVDSGGQAQFTDLSHMFVRGNSLYIIVMKVTESLHDKPTFIYSIDDKPVTAPKEMTRTNLQIIESFVRSVVATSRGQIGDNSEPAFAIVATHCDKSKLKRFLGLEETIKEKNETLLSCLGEFLDLFIFYNHESDELIFPVENLCQQNREKISADIRQRLVFSRSDIIFNIKIPLRWYAFDLNMKNEASKETHGMISLESCYSIGRKLGMDKKEVIECLIYLDSMRLCIYYPKDLDHVVFTNPQFLIDCLSSIAVASFVKSPREFEINLSSNTLLSLRREGIFDQSLLDNLGLTFIPHLFSKEDLLLLLQALQVIAPIEFKASHDTRSYFIPIILSSEQLPEKQKSLYATSADPLLISFNDKLILQGLFPTLIVSLLSRKEEPFFFIDSSTTEFPQQLRHAVKLYTEDLFVGSVLLCENVGSIEVYFTGQPRHCYSLRKVILEALSVSAKVLQYDEEKLNMSALVCCNHKHILPANDKKIHPIAISYKTNPPKIGCSVETSPTITVNDLSKKQSCWLVGTAVTDPETISLPTDGDAILNHTHAPIIIDAIKSVVFQWETLGMHLGIQQYELKAMKYNCRDQVEVCRKDMIYHWIDTGHATCNILIEALKIIEEHRIVDDIKRLQTA